MIRLWLNDVVLSRVINGETLRIAQSRRGPNSHGGWRMVHANSRGGRGIGCIGIDGNR